MGTTTVTGDDQETVLGSILRASNTLWGGFVNLHITDKRIVVESVMSSAAAAASFAAGGIVGALVAQKVGAKKAQEINAEQRTLNQILASSGKNYAIKNEDITAVVLKRKALPIGCSRFKITSKSKNVTYAFKREMFDSVSTVLNKVYTGKITIK
jgi:hypothetical protein